MFPMPAAIQKGRANGRIMLHTARTLKEKASIHAHAFQIVVRIICSKKKKNVFLCVCVCVCLCRNALDKPLRQTAGLVTTCSRENRRLRNVMSV